MTADGKRRRRIRRVIAWVVLLLLGYFFYTACAIRQYGLGDETRKADTAIILGAATTNGTLSPVYKERVNHGIRLYREECVGCLIVTGGVGKGNAESDARAAARYAIGQGVPAEAVLLEETSSITQGNIENAAAIMRQHGLQTALIVSDPLHMKRAMRMAADCGMTAYSAPTTTSRYVSWRTKLPFLCRETFFYIGYQLYRLCG